MCLVQESLQKRAGEEKRDYCSVELFNAGAVKSISKWITAPRYKRLVASGQGG